MMQAFLDAIPHEFARRHLVLLDETGERLLVAASTSPAAAFNVGVRLGRTTPTTVVPGDTLASAIDLAYAAAARDEPSPGESHLVEPGSEAGAIDDLLADADLLATSGKSDVVRLVDLLIFEALQRRASDVHIQPVAGRTLIRYRLDGVLHTVRELPRSLLAPIVSRVKVMARLDVAEQRAPQDGRATVTIGKPRGDQRKPPHRSVNLAEPREDSSSRSRRIDVRISTLPTTYGERVVLRLLDASRSSHLRSFSGLGMPANTEAAFLRLASRTSGIVLVTGPTGSGKTTTLYTTLAWISKRGLHGVSTVEAPALERTPSEGERQSAGQSPPVSSCPLNIMTIEDPVEYDLATEGLTISQTQLAQKKGVTFAAGLRHILRQDPDVIMVGEIRDEETARVAVQASLTGHLVLSTMHTNDAPSAVTRLLDLGIEPYLVSSTLAAALAQRLARTLHPACRGSGCEQCGHTGFLGRVGIFELFELDDALRELVASRASASELKKVALAHGMRTLAHAGDELVARGLTTPDEVARVIEGLDG